MNAEGTKKTSFTYELTNDQQELLLGVMLNGNYRKREVPYSLWSIEEGEGSELIDTGTPSEARQN